MFGHKNNLTTRFLLRGGLDHLHEKAIVLRDTRTFELNFCMFFKEL
jgi:hypothetical protein